MKTKLHVSHLIFLMLFASVLAVGPRMLNIDGDLPRHLLMGRHVLETYSVPTTEIFAFPYEGREYVSHEWLAGVLFFLSYKFLGLDGVILLSAILIAVTFWLVSSHASDQGGYGIHTFLLILLSAMVTSIHWIPRPHLFTMLFFALWLVWLNRLSRGENIRLWRFAALMFLWGNIHAESVVGFLAILAYLAGWCWGYMFERIKPSSQIGLRLTGAAGLSFLASLINPSGIRSWETILSYIGNTYLMSRIAETRPPDFSQSQFAPLALLLVITIVVVVSQRKRFSMSQIFLVAGFSLLSLTSARNAHLIGVAAPVILVTGLGQMNIPRILRNLDSRIRQMGNRRSGMGLLPLVFIAAAIALFKAGPLRGYNRFDPSIFPVQAVSWLETNPHPAGHLFNAFDWGGYILFRLYPQEKVFIESQTDTTGELTKEYEQAISPGGNWRQVFDRNGIDWAILPPDWFLSKELISAGWVVAYEDQTAVILVEK